MKAGKARSTHGSTPRVPLPRESLGEYSEYQYNGEPLFKTVGSDGDVLIGQDGNDQLFADELVNVSGLVSFENFGGTVGTGTNGDFLTDGTNDDVLVSGAGNDALYGGTGKDLVLGGAGNDLLQGDDRHPSRWGLVARLCLISRREKLVEMSNVHPSIFSLSYD
jgi:hypothetical protein